MYLSDCVNIPGVSVFIKFENTMLSKNPGHTMAKAHSK